MSRHRSWGLNESAERFIPISKMKRLKIEENKKKTKSTLERKYTKAGVHLVTASHCSVCISIDNSSVFIRTYLQCMPPSHSLLLSLYFSVLHFNYWRAQRAVVFV